MARGTLRIYLGAATRRRKTVAMLNEGSRRGEPGHRRRRRVRRDPRSAHTQALIGDLEVVSRRAITYRDATFEEKDVDAVLARAPEVALVDELAHTNVPGSRNEKRWQDVEELSARGST